MSWKVLNIIWNSDYLRHHALHYWKSERKKDQNKTKRKIMQQQGPPSKVQFNMTYLLDFLNLYGFQLYSPTIDKLNLNWIWHSFMISYNFMDCNCIYQPLHYLGWIEYDIVTWFLQLIWLAIVIKNHGTIMYHLNIVILIVQQKQLTWLNKCKSLSLWHLLHYIEV
jgi:hypothetical protein